ncbi:ComEC/Rec2 family competence protein [Streptomyces sp. H27-D2]|uniref:ComEC/Rec2 family competence protein n=1 Tax=Streptomyces sp. H27-D2 TaxID=3046304 RepID=UPI002DB7B69A|nr:ComEC/Rec2 family competence protein [Streptomyces sp. H27-D2]MEC4014810.1 ComEC/Rec2 family competence protein [Streptomyces sp. H27-D2]
MTRPHSPVIPSPTPAHTPARIAVHAAADSPRGASDPRQESPPDLRLVPLALAAWAAAALALGASGGAVAVACGAACFAAVILLFAAYRRRRTDELSGSAEAAAAGADAPDVRARVPAASAANANAPRGRAAGAAIAAAGVLLCAVAGAASAALHAADLYRGPIPALAGQYARATVEVTVTSDPRVTRPHVRGSAAAPPAALFEAEAVRVTDLGGAITTTRTPVLVIAPARPSWLRLLPSTRLRAPARFAPALGRGDSVAAVLRVRGDGPPQVVGAPTGLQRTAGELRAGLRAATDGLGPDARALLPGLVVGDTSRIPPELDEAFRSTDLLHLLSVSGANLTIVLALLIGPPHLAVRAERRGLAPRLGIGLRSTALIGGALTLGFVIVCRPDPSVLRAAACGLITLLAIGTGRRRSLLPALAAAVLLLVLYDPWLARSYGFLLSVLATGALLVIAPGWSLALQRRGVPPRLAEVLAAAAAAQAVCAPVVAVLAARISLVAVPCNLLAELAVAPATVLGFAALAMAPLAPPIAEFLAWLAGWPAEWIAGIARTGAAFPGAELGWPGGWTGGLLLALATAVLLPVVRRLLRHPWLCAACALLLIIAVVRPPPLTRAITGWPPPGWRLVACDVGQGDAFVLATGDGSALVVDTGPEPRAVDSCLRALGVVKIPLLVLTHFHADHVAGLPGALRGRSVGAIETTTLGEPPGQAEFVRRQAANAHVPLVAAVPGERRRLGALSWEVLWPPPAVPPPGSPQSPASPVPAAPPAPADGPNDASVTLLVRTAGLTVLMLGDLEPPAQQALLASRPALPPVDVLKVAHHGSAYQDPELLRRVHPRLALISAGADNPYGHPAPRTVAALRAEGAAVLRTDTDGPVAVTGSGPGRDLAAAVGGRAAAVSGRRRASPRPRAVASRTGFRPGPAACGGGRARPAAGVLGPGPDDNRGHDER